MIIGFDFQPLVQKASGGEVQQMAGIIGAYARRFPGDRILLFDPDDFSLGLPPCSTIERISADRHVLHELETDVLRSRSVDVLVRAYPTLSNPVFPMQRQIVYIPDMQFAERPEFSSAEILRHRRLAFGRTLAEVGAVATNTEDSRRTVLRYPWTMCSDVFLMPPAVDVDSLAEAHEDRAADAALEARLRGLSNFFFMPANSWPHKNHRRLFEAFERAQPRLPPGTGLILTGAGNEWALVLQGVEHLPIRHLGYLSRPDIGRLYRRALGLVYFSQYEGFGMPLLEAFHFGIPVACSNIAPLAEVGGDAVVTCAPDDIAAMAELMVRMATDFELRKELVEKGEERLKQFTYEHSAQALHDGIRRVDMRARAGRPATIKENFGGRISVVLDADLAGPAEAVNTSLLDQSHHDWELLVASAAPQSSRVKDQRIRTVVEPTSNAAERGSRALALATGEARIYLRPDCVLVPDALARIAARYGEDPGSDIIVSGTASADDRGETVADWSMHVHSPESFDPRALSTFVFENVLTSALGRDLRTMRPLVAWRRRIEAYVPSFDPRLPFGFDIEYWLRLISAGGTLAVINDRLATIRLTNDPAAARIWYDVMRDCQQIASRLPAGVKFEKRFFRLRRHRRRGLDPAVTGVWRGLPKALGWCDYRIHRARTKLASRVPRICKSEGSGQ